MAATAPTPLENFIDGAFAAPPKARPQRCSIRRDVGRALRVSAALRFGCVWINDHIPLASEMPHGGYGQSGHGKDLSMYAVEDYTHVKHVMASLA